MSRVASLTPEFLEETVTLRNVTYRLRELSIGEYDELVRKATKVVPNPMTGADDETIDNSLLLKLMVMKCSVEPKLTPETLAAIPMRAALRLNQTVNRMHYGDEPDAAAKPAEGEEEAKGEG